MSNKKNYCENAEKSHGGGGISLKRIEVIVKMQKKRNPGGGGRVGEGQGGCERRIEVFVKIQKKSGGAVGVRVDVDRELRFL